MATTPRHQAALDLVAAGIPVIVIRADRPHTCDTNAPGGKCETCNGFKRPAAKWGSADEKGEGWEGGLRTAEQVNAAWAEDDYNLAVRPASFGCMAIDIDGAKGRANWSALAGEHGIEPSRSHRSPQDGAHLFLAGDAPPSAGKLGDGIDVRGRNSYVLWPPSTLNGRPYTVATGNLGFARAPAWIAAVLDARDRSKRAAAIEADGLDAEQNIERARARLRQRVENGDVAVEGQGGDNHTYRVAAETLQFGLSAERAVELIEEVWNPHCRPPWDHDELETKVGNALSYMQNGQGADAIEPGSRTFAGAAAVEEAVAASGGSFGRFKLTRIGALVKMRPVRMIDHGDAMLPEGPAIGILYGPSGSHKTNVLLTKLVDLALDGKRILYCAGEGRLGLGARLRAHCLIRGVEPSDLDEYFAEVAVPNGGDLADCRAFAAGLREVKYVPDVLVIDTLATCFAGLDEDTRTASMLTGNGSLGELAHRLGCALILVAHTNAEGKRLRGAEAFKGNSDFVLSCAADKAAGAVKLTAEKMRDGPEGHSTYFEVATVGGVPVPQRVTREVYDVLVAAGDKLTDEGIRGALQALGGDQATIASKAIVQSLYPMPRFADPAAFDEVWNKIARKLDKLAGDFPALWAGDGWRLP